MYEEEDVVVAADVAIKIPDEANVGFVLNQISIAFCWTSDMCITLTTHDRILFSRTYRILSINYGGKRTILLNTSNCFAFTWRYHWIYDSNVQSRL